jgi:signal transduction histidine kinase
MRTNNYTGNHLLFLLLLFFFIIPVHSALLAQTEQLENEPVFSTRQLLRDTAIIQQVIKEAGLIEEDYPDSAVRKIHLALESSFKLKYNRGILKSFTELGVLYHIHNQNLKAIKALQLALPYCDTGKAGHVTTTKIYTAIAYRYMFIDMNDSAAFYYYKALDEIDRWKIDNPDVLINTYSQMIMLWLNLNENPDDIKPNDKYIETAVAYLNKAEQLEQKNNITLGKIILSKGHINYLLHRFDSARFHYRRFVQLAAQPDMASQSSFITSTYVNMATTFLIQKAADSAIHYSLKAFKKIAADGNLDTNLLITSGYNMGEAYLLQKRYKEAIQATLPALAIARTQSLYGQYAGHEILSKAYGAMGNYKAAWEQQKLYSEVRDSLTLEKNIQTISQMEMKYRVAERDKELVQKELTISSRDNKIKTQNLWIGGTLASALLITLISVLLHRQNIHKQRMEALQMQQEKEMALMQAMIEGEEKERNRLANELHDGIGGLLGTIRMQLGAALKSHQIPTASGEFKDILLLLESSYDELRKTAHNLMPEILQQEGLEIATGIFCDRVRKADTLEVNYETVGSIPRFRPSLELALYRIIQELMHNILKHARASEALVQLAFIGDCLSVTVEDNGIGMQGPVNNSKAGMGIKTIQERIRKMGGKFDISSSVNNGTSINLEFNITGKDMTYLKMQ